MLASCSKCGRLFVTTQENAYTPGVVCVPCHDAAQAVAQGERYEVRHVAIEYGNPSWQVWDKALNAYVYWTGNVSAARDECEKLNGELWYITDAGRRVVAAQGA